MINPGTKIRWSVFEIITLYGIGRTTVIHIKQIVFLLHSPHNAFTLTCFMVLGLLSVNFVPFAISTTSSSVVITVFLHSAS